MTTMTRLASIAFLSLMAWTAVAVRPLAADVVHLKNGRSFEDVIAEVGESDVTIRMAYGTMRLPLSRVERVEKAESGLAEYLVRAAALRVSDRVDGGDWLDLALWARTQGLDHGVREAALQAGELDPYLPGLEPVMRRLQYVLDPDLARWVPFAESMRRQGFVLADGIWISRQEMTERRRVAEIERTEREDRREAERAAAQQAELAAYRQLLLEVAVVSALAPPAPVYASYVGYPVLYPTSPIYPVLPGPPFLPPHVQPIPMPFHSRAAAAHRAAIVSSQPGSILPIMSSGHSGSTTTIR